MKVLDKIKHFFQGIQDYLESEKELLRLKAVKVVSSFAGHLFSMVFLLILFHTTIALLGIWLGFWLSEVFDSFTMGFGITVIIYLLWFILTLIFRKALLVKPFTNAVVSAMADYKKEDEEDQEH